MTTTAREITTRYQRAFRLARGAYDKSIARNTTLYPHWVGDSDTFWYVRDTSKGKTFQWVDASTGNNQAAFDHDALCTALTKASGEILSADNLPVDELDLTQAPAQLTFSALGKRWHYNRAHERCDVLYPLENVEISPDGQYALLRREGNLWLREMASGNERPLTADGNALYAYASTPTVFGSDFGLATVEARWSPDSKRIFTLVIDTRDVGVGMPLVEHVPADGSLRPTIINPDRRVAFPGDEYVDVYRFLSIDLETGKTTFAQTADCPITFMPYQGYFTHHRGWWDIDNRHCYFVEEERGMKAHRLQRFDTDTGHVTTLIEETSDYLAMLIPTSHSAPLYMPMPETNEVIWYSERSGTAHFYLYDTHTGRLKNTITQGDWIVRNGLRVDSKRRELTLQTASRIEGRNPYYCDICRVNIDSGELIEVISTDHEYVVCDRRSRISPRGKTSSPVYGVAPSGNYIVTTRSRVDQIPVSLLLDRDGREVTVLETADVSGLPEGVVWPEPVMLKAEDGETDIYAVVFRPSGFDPNKSYPVLDCTVGYCSPVGSFSNAHGGVLGLEMWSLAELGFIAVAILNRGPERLRDKAFNEYIDPELPCSPEQLLSHYNNDCVAGIKQLADRHPYMDLTRVGVAEFGNTPRAVAGLLLRPDFYHVGVSYNSDVDKRIKSSMGMDFRAKAMPQLVDFADRLEGKLLLIANMLNPVVPVSMTFRLVDALHKANKRFDMLILPEAGHHIGGNAQLRCWDYLVEHLQKIEPPKDFDPKKHGEEVGF